MSNRHWTRTAVFRLSKTAGTLEEAVPKVVDKLAMRNDKNLFWAVLIH